jgi:hypothetical protein
LFFFTRQHLSGRLGGARADEEKAKDALAKLDDQNADELTLDKAKAKLFMYEAKVDKLKAELALADAQAELADAKAEDAEGSTDETRARVSDEKTEVARCKANYDNASSAFFAASEAASRALNQGIFLHFFFLSFQLVFTFI